MGSSQGKSRSGRGKEQFEVSSGVLEIDWRGSVATLFLNGVESSCIDVNHPEHLEFEYMQHMDAACRVILGEAAPLQALHIGGAGGALAWSWSITHPRSRQTVIEIDELMIETVRSYFDLPRAPQMKMRCEDGRRALEKSRPGAWNVIVRDAFADGVVPQHLATRECARDAALALQPSGVYVVNAAHGGGADARREVQALMQAFSLVCAVVDPKVGKGGRRGNVVFICADPRGVSSNENGSDLRGRVYDEQEVFADLDRELRRLPLPARLMYGQALRRWHAGAASPSDASVGWGIDQAARDN